MLADPVVKEGSAVIRDGEEKVRVEFGDITVRGGARIEILGQGDAPDSVHARVEDIRRVYEPEDAHLAGDIIQVPNLTNLKGLDWE